MLDRHPLDVERLIGWLSFALGASALQANDSTFYRLVTTSNAAAVWIGAYCILGLALVASTLRPIPRCRIALLTALLFTWSAGVGLVAAGGVLGAYGSIGIVICLAILTILWTKVRAERSLSTRKTCD